MEKKIDMLIQGFHNGHHEGSIISSVTIESLSYDHQQTWRDIRKELEDIGISVSAFEFNKGFILEWFQRAIANGSFQESREGSSWEDIESETSFVRTIETSQHHVSNGDAYLRTNSEETTEVPSLTLYPSLLVEPQNQNLECRQGKKTIIATSPETWYSAIRQTNRNNMRNPKKTPRNSLISRVRNHHGYFCAAVHSHDFVLAGKYLSSTGIDTLFNGSTILCLAVQQSNLESTRWLLKHGANPNIVDYGMNLLELALVASRTEPDFMTAHNLSMFVADINFKHTRGSDPHHVLYRATLADDKAVMRCLNERGSNTRICYVLGVSTITELRGSLSPDTNLNINPNDKNIVVIHMLLQRGENVVDTDGRRAFLIFTERAGI